MKAKVAKIKAHGITCFVNRQLVYNYPESLFAAEGIMCIEHADFEGVERLALVTGGEIASTFDRPDLVKLGQCARIEEIMIGDDRVSNLKFFRLDECRTDGPLTDDQVLRRSSRSSMHRHHPRSNNPDGRRSRTITA